MMETTRAKALAMAAGVAASLTGTTETEKRKELSPAEEWNLLQYVVIGVQLGLLALVIRQFQIESAAFLRITLLAFSGFAVHYFLPLRLRLPFFVLLSLAGIGLVFGLSDAAWLFALGGVLIAICHLPVPFGARVIALIAAGALLAGLRTDWMQTPWSHAIWPLLGSMFMFRIMVYLYDIRHQSAPFSIWGSLGYFFLLPNVCFPLFPVVDYKTFRRNYYDVDRHQIYQTGINWMVRGLVHLVLYRLIYYYVVIAPSDVVDWDTLVQFLASNFLLYLRISGYFHIIVGMLHLFGFRLPETNHRYCLASSFTEFWRRINIYWKDFMMKVFYYPAYFKLRKMGSTRALVAATLFVFLVTWVFHSYQWFWLRGSFPIIWQDIVFWSILAGLVVGNSLYELRFGRKRSLRTTSWSLRESMLLGVRTVVTFSIILVLWSLWTCESFDSWLSMWSFVIRQEQGESSDFPTLLSLYCIALLLLSAVFGRTSPGEGDTTRRRLSTRFGTDRATAGSMALLVFLAAIGLPHVYTELGATTASLVVSLRQDKLSRLDAAALERGYYEDLTRVDRFNSKLWEVYEKKPLHWLDVKGAGLTRFTGDFLQRDLIPSFRTMTAYGAITINRWGMRDQDYERVPPSKTYRIALLGASSVMGWGVEDDETFEAILEERLNRERTARRHERFEILNFSVPGYFPVQQRLMLERALTFEPDAVYYVATGRELSRNLHYLFDVVSGGVDIPYYGLRDLIEQSGVDADMNKSDFIRHLRPYQEEILSWAYQEIADQSRQKGALPVWIFLPQLNEGSWEEETAPARRLAEEAGFFIVDLSGLYAGFEVGTIAIAEWDLHPNARAHELIAHRLYEAMTENDQGLLR